MCDPERMKLILKKLEVVYCEMQPGDAMLMHGNTLRILSHGISGISI